MDPFCGDPRYVAFVQKTQQLECLRGLERHITYRGVRDWTAARLRESEDEVSEDVRVAQVRQLFVAHHSDPAKRTATSALIFYGWLEQHRPELLPQGNHGDPFQHVRLDLSGLFE